jgi:hypothetical protein
MGQLSAVCLLDLVGQNPHVSTFFQKIMLLVGGFKHEFYFP